MKLRLTKFDDIAHAARGLLRAGLLPAIVLVLTATMSEAIEATRIATGLTIPLYVCAPPGDVNRIFVAEQGGKIKIVDLTTNTVLPTPFLDLTDTVGQGQGPGLLGMTFDPNYATNGYFYVSYSTDAHGLGSPGVSYVSRFTVSSDPSVADRASEKQIISAEQPDADHEWDWIGFSPRPGDENNLYICTGDGGVLEDEPDDPNFPLGYAQSTQTLLGKILRIHIEDDGSYTIPLDNPFFGDSDPSVRQEIFCYGLRNPFRASFDPVSLDMLIGDVGETAREEVDVQLASNPGGGENYGWRTREGFIQNKHFPNEIPPPDAVDPIFDYTHGVTGSCVIGGYIYHGSVSELEGLYVFGDCFGPGSDASGHVFTLNYQNGVGSNFQEITSQLFPTKVGGYTLGPLTSMGEDASGELYLTDFGNVFKIVNDTAPTPTPTPSVTPTPTPTPSDKALNLSTRVDVQTGTNVGIGGFIITGTDPKLVVVRAKGPSLTNSGVAGALADPVLDLHDSTDAIIATNDDWMDNSEADQQLLIDHGLAPTNDFESAIIMTLDPGLYTAVVSGNGGGTGVALIELYDLDDPGVTGELGNISTRGFVGTEANVMIAGVIVGPEGGLDAAVVVRAIGPSLANFGITDPLLDPVLELRDGNGDLIAMNDNWETDAPPDNYSVEVTAAGLAPSDASESAIFANLTNGLYTATVSGKDGTTGAGLVEVYHVAAQTANSAGH